MIEKGALSNESIRTFEDIPVEKRNELMVQVKTMLVRGNISLQESME